MREFVRTFEDNGGVRTNSGIPNHAVYLAAMQISGHAWEKDGRNCYETLRDPRLQPNSRFGGFARRTIANTQWLFGRSGAEEQTVRNAWN
jgi:Zn-dependent metalloprotease